MVKSRLSSDRPITAAFDRGAAKHFHGRERILSNFNELLTRATQAKSGTTFLIHGAPGAGKTALLAECEKQARNSEWGVVEIGVDSLWDPHELREDLGWGRKSEITEKSTQIGMEGVLKREVRTSRPRRTVLNILRDGKDPLLLKLDEAHVLGDKDVPPSEYKATTIKVLDFIHNGKLKRPVILLAAGLGTTLNSFQSFGIARYSKKCRVELGALSMEAERAVIQDWLKKDGGAKGDPTVWIDAIAKETHGWPHHILSYVEPAAGQLKADDGTMTTDGLSTVLEAGRSARLAYYKERSYGFPEEERQSLIKAFSDASIGESMTRSEIVFSLTQDFGPDKAQELFYQALDKGLLDEHDGRYVIPIPSMHTWLKEGS